jgi:hypothetical protein
MSVVIRVTRFAPPWVAVFLGSALFYLMMKVTLWTPLRFWSFSTGQGFADLRQLFIWSECFQVNPTENYYASNECRGYIYGSTLMRLLTFFKFGTTSTSFIASIAILLLCWFIAWLWVSRSGTNPLIQLFTLFSPPIFLLAERANIDILVALFILFAALLINGRFYYLAIAILSFASVIKFYPLPILALCLLYARNLRQSVFGIIAILISTLVIFSDLLSIKESFPSYYSFMFGMSVWARYLRIIAFDFPGGENVFSTLVGIPIAIAILLAVMLILKKRQILKATFTEKCNGAPFIFFTTAHATCFYLGMSFDYRMILLICSAYSYLNIINKKRSSLEEPLVQIGLLISLWLSFAAPGLEPLGDLAIQLITTFLTIRLFQFVKRELERRLKNMNKNRFSSSTFEADLLG